jgi:hypothetical protein
MRTNHTVLAQAEGPLFFNFHTVSSHAPWEEVPAWDENLDAEKSAPKKSDQDDKVAEGELRKRLRRLRRDDDHVFAHHGQLDSLGRQAYGRAIEYELQVLGAYLRQPVGDRLVLIMGDHQPPVLAEANASFQVPIHVLASDPALLEDFLLQGFQPGIIPSAASAIRHEAIFSLLVRSLARCCSDGSVIPVVRPQGVTLGG